MAHVLYAVYALGMQRGTCLTWCSAHQRFSPTWVSLYELLATSITAMNWICIVAIQTHVRMPRGTPEVNTLDLDYTFSDSL